MREVLLLIDKLYFLQGVSVENISKLLNANPITIKNRIKYNNGSQYMNKEKILALYHRGFTKKEIVARLDVSASQVNNWIKLEIAKGKGK